MNYLIPLVGLIWFAIGYCVGIFRTEHAIAKNPDKFVEVTGRCYRCKNDNCETCKLKNGGAE